MHRFLYFERHKWEERFLKHKSNPVSAFFPYRCKVECLRKKISLSASSLHQKI